MNAARRRLLVLLLGACALPASAVGAAAPTPAASEANGELHPAWNRFYDYDQMTALLKEMVAAWPNLLSMESIGRSVEGRDMWVVTLNNPATGPAESKPAMYIDGNVHGNEVQASETVMYTIWYLAKSYGNVPQLTELIDRSAFYFIPSVNPDGRQNWFANPHTPNSSRSGVQPTDDDHDGLLDEDGPEDLDGDGSIGVMWRPDPNGTHRRDRDDPRLFVRVEPGQKGDWSFAGSEGIDNDGDGQVNEDGPGGYDMNRNWPTDWQPDWVQGGAGVHPFSYPETKCIGAFVLAHPNIAAGQSYHNAGGMILRGPGAAYLEREYPRQDIAVYERIGKAGEELLPFYRLMVIHADLYTVHGGFVNWLAEGLGIVSFTNELWTDKRWLQNGQTPEDEKARMRLQDRLLFGQTFTDWTEYDHPEFGKVLIGGGTKWSSRTPPPFMLEEECHRNFAFTMFHAQQMPKLAFERTDVKQLAPRLWQVTVEIGNSGMIPSRTARAAQERIGEPDTLSVSGDGIAVVAAGTLFRWTDRTMFQVERHPERLRVESGIPGQDESYFRFIVEGDAGATLTLRYEAEKARNIETTVRLEETNAAPVAAAPATPAAPNG
ncbi:MAG: hypothetical protein KDA22_03635 [Phycisphaerales bacterium]|nr:hypothetical protein [Phycisphaerales bacterium]